MAGRIGGWFMTLRSPFEIWELEPTFLGCELVFYAMAILAFLHAYRQGGRWEPNPNGDRALVARRGGQQLGLTIVLVCCVLWSWY